LGDAAGLAEGLGDEPGVVFRVFVPSLYAGRAVDADAAGRTDADLAHLLADDAGLADLGEEALALFGIAHGRTAAGATPDRGDEGTDLEPEARNVVGLALDLVAVAVDRNMRIGKPEVDA